jgi:hypothetical protein
VKVKVEGIDADALVDTGSMVSTISEDFVKRKLPCVTYCDDVEWVTVHSSTGHTLPYTGVICVTVQSKELADMFQCPREAHVLALVVPGQVWSQEVPLLLGTNVFGKKGNPKSRGQLIRLGGRRFCHQTARG